MEIYKNEKLRKQIVTEGSEWIGQQQFTFFGTATYYDGAAISRDEAVKDAKHFFNMLDRRVLKREDYNNNVRLNRLVFVETGRTRTNTHIHFYIKGNDDATEWHIKEICEHLWANKITKGYNLLLKDNKGTGNRRNGYCLKEMGNLNADALLVDCCYLG